MMKKRRRQKTGGNDDEEEEKTEDRGKHDTVVPFMSSHYMCCIIWIVNIDHSDYGSPLTSAGTGTGSFAVHIPALAF